MEKKNQRIFLALSAFLGLCSSASVFSQVNVNLTFNTDFTWKALSATPNGGFISVGGSNAWMLNTYNAAGWPNAVAGSWGIPAVNDIAGVQHIWNTPYNDSVLLRKEFVVPVADSYTGNIQSQVDNQYSLFFNGVLLGAGSYNPSPPANYNIAPSLQGCVNNVVAMEARNWSGPYGAKMAISITAINVLNPPVANPATNVTCNSFTANWDTVATADLYLLDVSTDPLFATFYSVYQDFNVGNVTSYNLTSLPGPGPYYYRLRAQRTNGAGLRISCYSNVITVNFVPNPVSAGNDGYICPGSATVLNGVGAGTPSWSPPAGLSQTNVLNPSANPLVTTTYTLTLTTAAGCAGTDSVTVTVANLPALSLSNDTSICAGACTNLNVAGGDYFIWSPYPGMVDSSLTTQAVCPIVTTTYTVTSYSVGPNLIVNGNFTAGNTGFSSSYTYAFPNTTQGEYYVGTNPQLWNGSVSPCGDHTSGVGNMMMVNGSPAPNTNVWCQTVNVSPNTDYLFSTWVTPVYAVNLPTLQFSINGSPLSTPFTPNGPNCNWEEFFTTWNAGVNTTANICIVNQNTNINGNDFGLDDISFSPVCTQTGMVDVTVVPLPVPAVNNTGPYCAGDLIQLNSPSGSATDDWTGPAGYTANDVQNPSIPNATIAMDGIYTVTVTDAIGCFGTATTTVVVNALPVPIIANDGPVCEGGTINLTSGGGNTYSWIGPNGFNDPVNQNPVLNNMIPLQSGMYTVTVTDINNCSVTATTNVLVNSLPAVNANINSPVCEGLSFTLTGTGAVNYDWTGPNGFTVINDPAPQVNNSTMQDAGTYTVTGTDGNGCSATATVIAVVNPSPVAGFTSDLTSGCTPLCVNFTDNSNITGSTIVSWTWTLESQNPMSGPNTSVCFNDPGSYDVSLTVASAEGCTSTLAIPNMINAVATPVADFTYAPQAISETDPQVSFTNTSFAATIYSWDLGDGGTSSSMNVQHTYTDTGTYCVTLLASNAIGCSDTVTHCLIVHPFFTLYIPNSFTPNEDEMNQIFRVYGNGIKTIHVSIFDRWGEEIYAYSDIKGGWGGLTTSGAFCPQATYVYKVDVVDVFNKEHGYIGMVNLIR